MTERVIVFKMGSQFKIGIGHRGV